MNEKDIEIYHIFTDNRDEYRENLEEAKQLFYKYIDEHGKARLYIDIENQNGETLEEDCLEAYGDFPR